MLYSKQGGCFCEKKKNKNLSDEPKSHVLSHLERKKGEIREEKIKKEKKNDKGNDA